MRGPIGYHPLYFMPAGKFAEGIAKMPLSVYASGSKVKAADGAETEMYYVKPYFNKGWDGLRSNYYIPPQEVTDEPFFVRKGNIIYIAAEPFHRLPQPRADPAPPASRHGDQHTGAEA